MDPLNLRLDGDPESVRAMASWLKALGEDVSTCSAVTKRVVESSAHHWRDDKADEYRDRWDSGGRSAAKLADEIELYVDVYHKCADALQTAKGYIRQARELAETPPYLTIDGDFILPPEPDPHPRTTTYGASNVMQDVFADQVALYRSASDLIRAANDLIYEVSMHLGPPPVSKDLPRFFKAVDYVNGAVGAIAQAYQRHLLQAAQTTATYRGQWAGLLRSLDARDLATWAHEFAADDLARARAASAPATATSKTVDLTGKALLGLGIGYDIFVNGEPWDKAVLEGVSSYAGGVVGSVVGAGTLGWAGASTGGLAPVLAPAGVLIGGFGGAYFGSEWGEGVGTDLYARLESKTLVDDPDYFE